MGETPPITVPPTVRAYVESVGLSGRRWLEALPGIVQERCRAWGLQMGGPLSGGSRSYVCRVTTPEGEPGVLKVALPEPTLETQVRTLVAARGRGYVRVLAHDLPMGALLMESLGPPLGEEVDDVPAALALIAGTLGRAWQVPVGRLTGQDGAEHKAAGLFALVRDLAGEVGAPDLDPIVEQALAYARERWEARDLQRQVWVHGDPHAGNLLRVEEARPGAEGGYVFVDPEGFFCEPEYDLGVAVRGWTAHLLASADPKAEVRGWCEQMARATGTGAGAVWQWAYLERVSTGLYLHHHGLPQLGAPFLEVARRLLDR